MKKGIIVLLIAVLVSSFAFADFSGSAGVVYEANFDDEFFDTTNKKSLSFSFTFASEKIELDSAEDEIHVEVAASAKFILGKWKGASPNGIGVFAKDVADRGIGVVATLDTAKIVGKNWYVSVLGAQSAYDYAKAAVLQINSKDVKDDFGNVYDKEDQAASYKVAFGKADGITIGYNGFTASVGVEYVKDFALLASATLETPEFAFNDDAVKVQAAAEFARFKLGDATQYLAVNTFGASAKATVAIQDITVGAAVDMGVENIGAEIGTISEKDTEFNFDARVDFKYNFVDASIYTYAGKDGLQFGVPGLLVGYKNFYLEAKAAFDLNAFELPLKVTVSAKNITNSKVGDLEDPDDEGVKDGIEPEIKVEYAKDAITAGASFSINTEFKIWDVLAYGSYAFEKFTAGAGLYFLGGESDMYKISFGAFAESDKLVKGATFGLAYGLDGDDAVYSDGAAACISGSANYSANYKDSVAAGEIVAYCKIAF